jgi:transposase
VRCTRPRYKRHVTLSLLASIVLLSRTGSRLRRESPSFARLHLLQEARSACTTNTAIRIILDNHQVHASKETNKWLGEQHDGRFSFVLTPKHSSWLNLVEGFFSKTARSVLRRIRVASKAELTVSRGSWPISTILLVT